MRIGERIKIKRKEKGWSQRDLAARMGYAHHSTLARIESGAVDVSQTRIVQFSEALGVSVAYLMGWDDEIKNDPVGMAERHFEIIIDEDISEIFDDFKVLNEEQRKIIKDLVHSFAAAKKGSL